MTHFPNLNLEERLDVLLKIWYILGMCPCVATIVTNYIKHRYGTIV
jgi:hypothetical protein